MLEVRTAKKPEIPTELSVFLFSLIWIIFSAILLIVFERLLIIAAFQLFAIPLWFFLVKRQANINLLRNIEEAKYNVSLGGLVCQNCFRPITSPVKTQNINGEPVLYHCESCEILWFTGLVDNSSLS